MMSQYEALVSKHNSIVSCDKTISCCCNFNNDEADFSLRIVSLCSLKINGFRVTFDVCSFLSQEGGSRGSAVNFKKLKSDFRGACHG